MKKNLIVINAGGMFLVIAILLIALNGNVSLTGFTFAEFYDTQVMYTLNAISGETTTFVIPINNNQNQPIEGLYAEIEIKDLDGNSIVTIDTEPIQVGENERTEIKATWENNVLPGEYIAVIYLASEDTNAQFTKTFKIERRTITIEGIQANEFELGSEVTLDVIVQNHLETDITNTQATLLIYETEENIIDTIITQQITLNKSSLNKLQTTWDTKTLSPGTYNAKLVVTGEGYEAEEELVFIIGQNSLSVTGIGFAINYAPRSSIDTIFVIIIIITGIALINILVWILYLRKKKPTP